MTGLGLRWRAISPIPAHMDSVRVPRTVEELAALEAAYRPFDPVAAWAGMTVDAARWQRHADALTDAVRHAKTSTWEDLRDRFMRAAALDSSALSQMIRSVPDLTAVVLRSSVADGDWTSFVETNRLVVECQRRALVVASDVARAGVSLEENLIAQLQDLITESQQTYTVSTDDGSRIEVDLPRRQYKPVSNYLMSPVDGLGIVPFAPAARVAEEMRRLSGELNSAAFKRLHPVLQSAYAHFSLQCIHPFADGNGRLCRTIASIPLLREVGLPQLILADQWPAYIQALGLGHQGDLRPLVDTFLTAQINTMALARDLLRDPAPAVGAMPLIDSAERAMLDLVLVHLRAALGVPDRDTRLGVSRLGKDAVRVALTDQRGAPRVDLHFRVQSDDADGWLRVTCSTGDVLEINDRDIQPVPLEIAHLRVRSWIEAVLARGGTVDLAAAPARGLFVLGVPRSGTTMMGSYVGSHPKVLGLAEYGGFYAAHSIVPAYLQALPGREHEGLVVDLAHLAEEHAIGAARASNCPWYCDATPWNLQVAGALTDSLPDAVFILMLRHFSGAILSLRQFPWAGQTLETVAQLWVTLNSFIAQLPVDRTIVVSYDALDDQPAETIAGVDDALATLGLDPAGFDRRQLAASHAAIIGKPRPTIARIIDGQVVLGAIPSLNPERWTPALHRRVWPIVEGVHRALADQFPSVYVPPARPRHVPENEW